MEKAQGYYTLVFFFPPPTLRSPFSALCGFYALGGTQGAEQVERVVIVSRCSTTYFTEFEIV